MQKVNLVYHLGENVGDRINALIFRHFLGDELIVDGDEGDNADVQLLGIGSILGLKREVTGRKVVFSSGWGGHHDASTYGHLPEVDNTWEFRALRGRLTANSLSQCGDLPLLDGAYLVTDVLPRKCGAISGRVGFIPHHKSLDFYDGWQSVSHNADCYFLDPRLDPQEFIEKLWTCELVLCEAMHGAIFADAYRIPWKPIRLNPHICEFKWEDWYSSLGLEPGEAIHAPCRLASPDFMAQLIKCKSYGLLPTFIVRWISERIVAKRRSHVCAWLNSLKEGPGYLSNGDLLGAKKLELHDALLTLKQNLIDEQV